MMSEVRTKPRGLLVILSKMSLHRLIAPEDGGRAQCLG